MRQVIEPYLEAYIRDLALAVAAQHLARSLQTAAHEPPLRRQVAQGAEIALECREAPTRETGDVAQREVIHVVLFKEGHDVDLPAVDEVKQRCVEVLVGLEYGVQPLDHLQPQDLVRRLGFGIEILYQRLEEYAYVVAVRGQQEEAASAAHGILRDLALLEVLVELSQKVSCEFERY